jgi:hypothetical protein
LSRLIENSVRVELQDRGLERADGTQHDRDHGKIIPGIRQQLLSHGGDDVDAGTADFRVAQ